MKFSQQILGVLPVFLVKVHHGELLDGPVVVRVVGGAVVDVAVRPLVPPRGVRGGGSRAVDDHPGLVRLDGADLRIVPVAPLGQVLDPDLGLR